MTNTTNHTAEKPTGAGALPDYKVMNSPEMLAALGMDGKKWADAFIQIWGNRFAEVDHSLMISWFCNAIMAGYDEAMRRNQPAAPQEARAAAMNEGGEVWDILNMWCSNEHSTEILNYLQKDGYTIQKAIAAYTPTPPIAGAEVSEAKKPDFYYNAEDWEYTCFDLESVIESHDEGVVVEVGRLVSLPNSFVAIYEVEGSREQEEFATREEAEAAIAKAAIAALTTKES